MRHLIVKGERIKFLPGIYQKSGSCQYCRLPFNSWDKRPCHYLMCGHLSCFQCVRELSKCRQCEKGTKVKADSKKDETCGPHNRRHFNCDLCTSRFSSHEKLDEHHRKSHLKRKKPGQLTCYICRVGFSSNVEFARHIMVSHDDTEVKVTNGRMKSASKNCYLCRLPYNPRPDSIFNEVKILTCRHACCLNCLAGFKYGCVQCQSVPTPAAAKLGKPEPRKAIAKSKMCSKSPRNKEGCSRAAPANRLRFKCSLCPLSFASRISKSTHAQKAHKMLLREVCDKCGWRFRSRKDLERHDLIHTGCKPWSCSVCNKAFRRKSSLQRHSMRIRSCETQPPV